MEEGPQGEGWILMRRIALVAALVAAAIAVPLSFGSSHREAPLTSIDPTGDDTDLYAFTAKDAPGTLTVVGNWIPFEDPAGGPNFYRFDDRAHYYINIDNTGDGKYDIRYEFKFRTKIRNKNSFLYALPGVSSFKDPKLNIVQRYDIFRERYKNGKQVGEKRIAHNLPVAPNNAGPKTAVVGVWSSTERRRLQLTSARKGSGFVQVSRLGNPLVNEVVIPLGKKDQFNRTQPSQDAARYGKYVLSPELAKVMNALFHIGAPENNRTDIVQAVLQGIPGLNQVQGKGNKEPAVDTLKLNLGTPPSSSPNRFGVLAGDNAGYPNGRRLIDDVGDIDLRVFAGFLKGHKVPLGDGVDRNDVPFLSKFPYVAPPHSGYDSQLKRIEPPHAPTPAQPASFAR